MNDEFRRESFARVFAQHNRWLHAYLLSILADFGSAEEVFQEVCVILWREYEKFDPETDFRRWASVIARNKVYQFRASQARRGNRLSNEVLELISHQALEQSDLLEDRRVALHNCLKRLPESDQDLVSACYSDSNRSFKQVAEQLNRPINTVYKALQRIRRALRQCIDRQVAANG